MVETLGSEVMGWPTDLLGYEKSLSNLLNICLLIEIIAGPGDLGGQPVNLLRFDQLCDGQWAAMVKLSPRLPIKKQIVNYPTTPPNIEYLDEELAQKREKEKFLITETPDFEIIDDDYLF